MRNFAKSPAAPAAAATVIALTGLDLLKAIAAGDGGGLMLTQAEGADVVTAGDAVVDTTKVDGDKAFVTLTDQGKAKLAAPVVPAAPTVKPTFKLSSDIPMPTHRTGHGSSMYPIEVMEVGQSFHVPVTADNPDPASRIASSLSNARIKFAVKTGEKETVTVKEYQKTADGKAFAKGADGKRIVVSERQEERDVTKNTRDWSVATVDASDPEGPGARVWRTL